MLLCVSIVCSCSSDKLSESLIQEEIEKSFEVVENPYAMSEEKALDLAQTFINNGNKAKLRSLSTGSVSKTSVETENFGVTLAGYSEESTVKQNVPVYTINYKNDSGENVGYAVIAGDERISDNVMIFNNSKGNEFDLEKREDADFIKDLIAGFLFNKINNKDESKKDVNTISTKSVRSSSEVLYALDYFIHFAQSGNPYNRYTPFVNGNRAVAGSSAVAMSEIMAFYGWPLVGAYKRYTTSTSGLQTAYVSYALTTAERAGILANNMYYCELNYPVALEYVGNLISETGYKLGSSYGASFTSQEFTRVPSVFTEMGYTTNGLSSFNFSAIQTEIEQKQQPVYMVGYSAGNTTNLLFSHSFVIFGTYYYDGGEYILIAHGNGTIYRDPITGSGQVFFNKDMFSTNNNYTNFSPTGYEMMYPYIYNCKIITNIKPNTNNTGSTNPNWIAN